MQMRRLGRGGPEVSAIGYGAMGLSSAYGPAADRKDAVPSRRRQDEKPGRRGEARQPRWLHFLEEVTEAEGMLDLVHG